jgi:hypothetical protein
VFIQAKGYGPVCWAVVWSVEQAATGMLWWVCAGLSWPAQVSTPLFLLFSVFNFLFSILVLYFKFESSYFAGV